MTITQNEIIVALKAAAERPTAIEREAIRANEKKMLYDALAYLAWCCIGAAIFTTVVFKIFN